MIFVSSFSYPAQHNLNISFLYEPKIWKSISQACLNLIKQKNNKLRYLYSMFEKNLISSGVIFQFCFIINEKKSICEYIGKLLPWWIFLEIIEKNGNYWSLRGSRAERSSKWIQILASHAREMNYALKIILKLNLATVQMFSSLRFLQNLEKSPKTLRNMLKHEIFHPGTASQ